MYCIARNEIGTLIKKKEKEKKKKSNVIAYVKSMWYLVLSALIIVT